MLLKIAYLLMRWLFSLVVLVFRSDGAKDAELLVVGAETCATCADGLGIAVGSVKRLGVGRPGLGRPEVG